MSHAHVCGKCGAVIDPYEAGDPSCDCWKSEEQIEEEQAAAAEDAMSEDPERSLEERVESLERESESLSHRIDMLEELGDSVSVSFSKNWVSRRRR